MCRYAWKPEVMDLLELELGCYEQLPDVGAGNRTKVLWKISMGS